MKGFTNEWQETVRLRGFYNFDSCECKTLMKKLKVMIITTHIVVQLMIYGVLSYFHVWSFLFSRVFFPPPTAAEYVYLHSISVLPSVVVALLFIIFCKNTWRLHAVFVVENIVLMIIYSIVIWNIFYS